MESKSEKNVEFSLREKWKKMIIFCKTWLFSSFKLFKTSGILFVEGYFLKIDYYDDSWVFFLIWLKLLELFNLKSSSLNFVFSTYFGEIVGRYTNK